MDDVISAFSERSGRYKKKSSKSNYDVILIGFKYNGENELPGAIIDLWIANKFFIKNGYKPIIFTDIINSNQYDNFLDTATIINDNLEIILTNLNNPIGNKLILYYTGHGRNNNILLPNGVEFSINKIKKILDRLECNKYLYIFDGCHIGNINFPYYYDKPSNKVKFINGNIELTPTSSKILFITSSGIHSPALSTRKGSLFSHPFFAKLTFSNKLNDIVSYIDNNIKQIQEMHKYDEYHQSFEIYSSHMFDGDISPWLRCKYCVLT